MGPEKTPPRAWTHLGSRRLVQTPIFELAAHQRVHPHRNGGRPHDFFVLEAPEWVNIIPLTAQDQVVMVRQYRHGLRSLTLEIPGGMVDPGDRDPSQAARRELLEETGYHAARVDPLGAISPNPAIQTNLCHSFVARELTYRGSPQLDGTEEIETLMVPLEQVPGLIRDGAINHALVVVAFCHFLGLDHNRSAP